MRIHTIAQSLPRVVASEVTGSASDGRTCSAVDGSAAAISITYPVIIEYCCSLKSMLGQVNNRLKVIRVTKETVDQTTEQMCRRCKICRKVKSWCAFVDQYAMHRRVPVVGG